jgi:hypothetical protein
MLIIGNMNRRNIPGGAYAAEGAAPLGRGKCRYLLAILDERGLHCGGRRESFLCKKIILGMDLIRILNRLLDLIQYTNTVY